MIALRNAACALGIGLALAAAATAHASPAPDEAGSDCSWHENGTTITIGEESYTCHCAQLTGPMGPQVLCRWYSESALSARPAKKRAIKRPKPKPRKHVVRVYPKPQVVG